MQAGLPLTSSGKLKSLVSWHITNVLSAVTCTLITYSTSHTQLQKGYRRKEFVEPGSSDGHYVIEQALGVGWWHCYG